MKADRGEPHLERADGNRGGEVTDLGRVNADEVGESTLDNPSPGPPNKSTSTANGLTSQKKNSSRLASGATAEKVTIFFDVQLKGRESKDYSIKFRSKYLFAKAMVASASRLEKEVSSLRFQVAEGPP